MSNAYGSWTLRACASSVKDSLRCLQSSYHTSFLMISTQGILHAVAALNMSSATHALLLLLRAVYQVCVLQCMLTLILLLYNIAAVLTSYLLHYFRFSNTDDKEDVFSRRVDDEVEKVQKIT